jgi:hypothetical protein
LEEVDGGKQKKLLLWNWFNGKKKRTESKIGEVNKHKNYILCGHNTFMSKFLLRHKYRH